MKHIPVLLDEIIETFKYLKKGGVFVDGTLGAAGHSIAIANGLQLTTYNLQLIGIDQDQEALEIAKENIEKAGLGDNFILVHNNFKNIAAVLSNLNISKIDGALLDLGVSSMQFDQKERGFSFQDPAQPLDMRMDQNCNITAAKILNEYSESEIIRILRQYGEESFASKIARNIVETRKKKSFATVGDLLEILSVSIPKKFQFGKTHFATKTFQALRIEVNDELNILENTIGDFVKILKPESKLAIISFHSLEDRIVKQTFNKLAHPCTCPPALPCVCGKTPTIKILTSKPIISSESEISANPRSRSAKLRIIQKL